MFEPHRGSSPKPRVANAVSAPWERVNENCECTPKGYQPLHILNDIGVALQIRKRLKPRWGLAETHCIDPGCARVGRDPGLSAVDPFGVNESLDHTIC
jgi:hypothetical protein